MGGSLAAERRPLTSSRKLLRPFSILHFSFSILHLPMIPDTPKTLLRKIAEYANGDDAAEWERFVELYTPVIR